MMDKLTLESKNEAAAPPLFHPKLYVHTTRFVTGAGRVGVDTYTHACRTLDIKTRKLPPINLPPQTDFFAIPNIVITPQPRHIETPPMNIEPTAVSSIFCALTRRVRFISPVSPWEKMERTLVSFFINRPRNARQGKRGEATDVWARKGVPAPPFVSLPSHHKNRLDCLRADFRGQQQRSQPRLSLDQKKATFTQEEG